MEVFKADWDVVIVGGGPAGLSAALVLGRCCRRVLVCDTGTPRNWATKKMHAFLSRDGICPNEFSEINKKQLAQYENVVFVEAEITDAKALPMGFEVSLPGKTVTCRKLLIATGLMDEVPDIEGIRDFYGRSVFQCPYCDAWEWRDLPIAVYGRGKKGLEMCRAMTAWTRDIVLCSDGKTKLSDEERIGLERNGIVIHDDKIARLEGVDGKLESIVFRSGKKIARRALFFDTDCHSQSALAKKLGCSFTKKGGIACGKYEATCVPGAYVAGNIIKDVQLAVVAAAEGAKAAFGINRALTREDFDYRVSGEASVDHSAPEQRDAS